MRSSGIVRAKEEARELQPPGLGREANDTESLADLSDLAEISRQNEEEVNRRVTIARRLALEQLHDRYGDEPVSERVYRAYGLGRVRGDGGRRARVLRDRVLAVAVELTRSGIPFGPDALGKAVGDVGPGSARRIRHAIAQLIRAGRWPTPRGVAVRRQTGGESA